MENGRCHHARSARVRNYCWAESACPELPANRVAGPARIQLYPVRPAPHIEDVHEPGLDSTRVYDRRYLLGEVMHVPVAFGADRDPLLIGHERLRRVSNAWLI